MSSALATLPALETKWTIVSGPMKGTVRLMNSAKFTIGRSSECEFVIINDPKCSRKHAVVYCSPDGCEVLSLNDKNFVLVNGREAERARLNDGDIVTLGETEVQFNTTTMSTGEIKLQVVPQGPPPQFRPPPQAMPPMHAPPPSGAPDMPRPKPQGPSKHSRGGLPGGRVTFYVILALVGYWLFSESPKKKEELGIRTEQQIQADIEAAQKLRDSAETQTFKTVDQSLTARQAQENYVRGFRDYKKGQFERAMVSFQACLALNPDHALCTRYYRLSQRKFNELVQYQMVLGTKYRDQNQYRACRSSFKNVMGMVKDVNSSVYKQAKANYEACNALVEGRF